MRARTNLAWAALVAIPCLAGCTSFESEYEKGVYDYEPIYRYQTLGGVDCRRQPHYRDAARLVNYYGPAPSKYDAPEPPEASPPQPPPKVTAAYGPGAPNGAPSSASEVAAEEKSEWKEWLPLVSVGFGALQVVAAFAF